MNKTYKAMRISGGNSIFPDKLVLTESTITFEKGKLIGNSSISIKLSEVSGLSVETGLLFANITIQSTGGTIIYANGFSKSDAQELKEFLNK